MKQEREGKIEREKERERELMANQPCVDGVGLADVRQQQVEEQDDDNEVVMC